MKAPAQCPACGQILQPDDPALVDTAHCPNCRAPLSAAVLPTGPVDLRAVETHSDATPAASDSVGSAGASTGETSLACLGHIGRFELRAVLGQGTFGRVYRAYDPQLKREVALKVPKFGPDEPQQVERFLGEARAAARLRHPNVVAVFESGRAGDDYYIASEFVEGMPLSAHLRDGPPDFRQAARWVRDLASGLACAHAAGVIHRDIKPANILLDRTGRPQLADFGLAKCVGEEATRTADGTVLGTPAYMAPEQARGEQAAVGPHSDQYSLGVVLYELLARRRPFDGPPHAILAQVTGDDPPPPSRFNPAVPRDLEAVCLKAMAREPARRYVSAAELADDLDRFLAGEPVHARRAGPGERTRRWLRKHRQATLLAGGVTAAVLVTLGVVWWKGGFQPSAPPGLAAPAELPRPEPPEVAIEDWQKIQASTQNLSALGLAVMSSASTFGALPQHAIYGKDGKPLLSWRVALLPYLDQKTLYNQFHLDESWDSPHNRELLQHIPPVYEVPGVPTPRPYMTFYQVFVGPGAVFEPDPKRRVRLSDLQDDRGSTFLIVEARQPVEWTRPADLAFGPGNPLPRLGGVVPDGFLACFCDGKRRFLKKEIYGNDKLLRALIGRQDGELVNLRPYELDPYKKGSRPPTGDTARDSPKEVQERVAAARESSRKNASKNNLRQLVNALRSYADTHGSLPPPALSGKDGKPLLSWRVAILPYLGQKALHDRFRADEPWDGPHNRELVPFMPQVFTVPDAPVKDDNATYYQLFVGPGAFEPGRRQRLADISAADGTPNTIAIAEGGEPVPWTAPVDLPYAPGRPLPKLGGPFADGFHAVMFDGSAWFFKKEIYADEQALRALIGWNDGEVVNVRPYQESPLPLLPKDSPVAAPVVSARRIHSMNNLKQLALAFYNYHSTYGRLPPYAISDKDRRPLLSWRVALLPFLEQGPLYRKFKLDEPWDGPHNKKLLAYMPRLFDTAATSGEPDRTYYQVFVGPGAAFERDPRKTVRFTDISDGTSNTLLVAEAGTAIPWTKPEDLFFEPDGPLPRLGGLFADGFNACTADSQVHFLGRKLYGDERALRALIGIRDGQRVDLNAFR
jgi:hypothetical protein